MYASTLSVIAFMASVWFASTDIQCHTDSNHKKAAGNVSRFSTCTDNRPVRRFNFVDCRVCRMLLPVSSILDVTMADAVSSKDAERICPENSMILSSCELKESFRCLQTYQAPQVLMQF